MAYLQTLKPLGAYLIEAGLLSQAQVDVILADQTITEMQFGEIVVTRGWVKEQTIEYLMQKVILPEREVLHQGQRSRVEPSQVKPRTSQAPSPAQPKPMQRPTPPGPSGVDPHKTLPADPTHAKLPSATSLPESAAATVPASPAAINGTPNQDDDSLVQKIITANFPDDEVEWVG